MQDWTGVSGEPYWWEAAPRPPRREALPKEADVAVVGAGFTGLSAALALARAGRKVAVLEAGLPGSGASSRNGGMVGSGHRVGFAQASALYGPELARALLREGKAALDFTTRLIEEERVDCDFSRCGRFRGAWTAGHYEAMEREAEVQAREAGVEMLLVPKAEVGREVATERYQGGCLFPSHGGLHPGKFHNGLLALAEAAGAGVFAEAPVLSIARAGSGYRIETGRGGLAAGQVLVATNGYQRPGPGIRPTPDLARRLVPVGSFLIATEPLGRNRVRSLIPGGRMIVETRSRHCYYRASPDGERLVIGGRAALHPAASTGRSGPRLLRILQDLFPELRGVRVTHSWRGSVAMSRDGLPHLGQDREGLWYALGYSGSGVAMAPYLGHKAALKLLGDAAGDSPFEKTPFRAVPLYAGKPWFLRPLEAWYRWKDLREGSP